LNFVPDGESAILFFKPTGFNRSPTQFYAEAVFKNPSPILNNAGRYVLDLGKLAKGLILFVFFRVLP